MDVASHLINIKIIKAPSLRQRLGQALAKRYTVAGLRRFRQQLEHDMSPQEWTKLEAPAILLLADLCEVLGLSEQQRATVMGQQGEQALREALATEFAVIR